MRTRTLIVIAVLALVGAFMAVNWPAITAPAKFSLLFTTIEAPVGLVMLALLGLVIATFGAYIAVWQSAMLLESRRHARELKAQKSLADQAESSRFTELRDTVHSEFKGLSAHIEQLQDGLRTEIRDNANSLAASIGELDDRIHGPRSGGPAAG